MQHAKVCFSLWCLSALASVEAIRLITTKETDVVDLIKDADDMMELSCAVPYLRSKFEKACSVEEKLVSHEPLKPFQIAPAKFASTGERITQNAYRMGLPPELRKTILDYCAKAGIIDRFRQLVVRGDTLEAAGTTVETLGGFDWEIQRPGSFWNNNMHW